jgi:hypothetical protein
MTRAQKTARFGCSSLIPGTCTRLMSRYATKLKMSTPPASPSRPSVRFTALLVPTMTNAMKPMSSTGITSNWPRNGTLIPVRSKCCQM